MDESLIGNESIGVADESRETIGSQTWGLRLGWFIGKQVSAEEGISICIIDHHIPSLIRGINNRIGGLPNFNK